MQYRGQTQKAAESAGGHISYQEGEGHLVACSSIEISNLLKDRSFSKARDEHGHA